jgi:group I intron endonuclease
MYFLVYKTTNTINGKFYIGVHKTDVLDDEYFGSGKYLNNAIRKYGIENFSREILAVFDNEKDMFELEAILVTQDLVESKSCYNLKLGGSGGWDHFHDFTARNRRISKIRDYKSRAYSERLSNSMKASDNLQGWKIRGDWTGRKHSDETKAKMKAAWEIRRARTRQSSLLSRTV